MGTSALGSARPVLTGHILGTHSTSPPKSSRSPLNSPSPHHADSTQSDLFLTKPRPRPIPCCHVDTHHDPFLSHTPTHRPQDNSRPPHYSCSQPFSSWLPWPLHHLTFPTSLGCLCSRPLPSRRWYHQQLRQSREAGRTSWQN